MSVPATQAPTAPDAPVAADEPVQEGRTAGWVRRLGPYWAVIAWVAVVIVFSALRPETFGTWDNFRSILGQQAILAIVALAVMLPLICGQFDLSIAATVSLSAILTAGLMARADLPWPVAVLAGVGAGLAVGAVNALLIARLGVHSFIATLGVGTILGGIGVWYSQGEAIFSGIAPQFVEIGQARLLGLPIAFFGLIVIALVLWFALTQSPYGRYMYAIGSNRAAAAVAGVRVRSYTAMSLVLCGGLAGFAGVLLVGRQGSAQADAGSTFLLPAFAAAFIGAATFRRGEFNVAGTLVGVYFVATIVAGAVILGAANWVSPVLSGTALIAAVIGNRALARKLA